MSLIWGLVSFGVAGIAVLIILSLASRITPDMTWRDIVLWACAWAFALTCVILLLFVIMDWDTQIIRRAIEP